ncbi:MAG TPA: oxidoreductase-like domain-containing protein [Casimicrobiaceae bacterium]|nr:oxidoreductase-like domain-containing protein [Casimicrobiaceae bacterium]
MSRDAEIGADAGNGPPPVPPVRPAPEDCCNGGCARCVFDLYDDAMERYRIELAAWRARRAAGNPGEAR